jgi:hypothetical protein
VLKRKKKKKELLSRGLPRAILAERQTTVFPISATNYRISFEKL